MAPTSPPVPSSRTNPSAATEVRGVSRINREALDFYRSCAVESPGRPSAPFLLIDSKSLPRSGLHYLKNTLAAIFQDQFSFCEWYHEPGCCRSNPCALTGFAESARKSQAFHIRLLKSHDFGQTDPVFPVNDVVRRLILLRDPLYILTSWFELRELERHAGLLKSKGVRMEKIWMSHEPQLLAMAREIVDAGYISPGEGMLEAWLLEHAAYIDRFARKWLAPGSAGDPRFCDVVRYENLPRYVEQILERQSKCFKDSDRAVLDARRKEVLSGFRVREDPFSLRLKGAQIAVDRHRAEFERAASRLRPVLSN
jgi:hypothetical protein